MRLFRQIALSCVAAVGIAPAAEATWSIVLVDTATGEVAVGCATCLENFDLELYCPVVLVGIGGACAQSSIDSSGRNRRLIWDEMQLGTSPREILTKLRSGDSSHQSRQYGIVDLEGRQVTFTGFLAGAWAGGVTGVSGTIHYAIQGNVLTGQPVVQDAEAAVLNTSGDLAAKLMAGMEAAQAVGGDGRCSCDPADADRCGSPPPGFDPDTDKSAHVGFMIVARIGDVDGDCNVSAGCSNGSYYMNHNVANQDRNDEDPVLQMRTLFDQWRDDWRNHADHLLSTKTMSRVGVPGNGTTPATLTLALRDWEGTALTTGGATITVSHAATSAGLASIGTVEDNGDGTYSVELRAGVGQGTDVYDLVVDDGRGPVTLYPSPTLKHNETLKADAASISSSAGGTISFDLVGPDEEPPADYLLLCSASGTAPGLLIGKSNIVLPLNYDDVMWISYYCANTTTFVNTDNVLDADGKASAQFHVEPDELQLLVGFDLAFAYLTNQKVTFASNFKLVTIDP